MAGTLGHTGKPQQSTSGRSGGARGVSSYQTPPRRSSGPRKGWRVSPSRSPGVRGAQFEYWDRDRKVSVKIVLRPFELGCLFVAFLAVVLSICGGKLSSTDQGLIVALVNILSGNGWPGSSPLW
jgi:hypothetical protein